jgi:hypothetical protein
MSYVDQLENWMNAPAGETIQFPAEKVTRKEWNLPRVQNHGLIDKLEQGWPALGDVADIFVGIQTSADDVFMMKYVSSDIDTITLYSETLQSNWQFEREFCLPIVSGTDVIRYQQLPYRQYVLFPYRISERQVSIVELAEMTRDFPQTAEYLKANKLRLSAREKGKVANKQWHGYIYLKNMRRQAKPKLCIPRLVDRLYASSDLEGTHCLDNVDVGGIVWNTDFEYHSLEFLLGMLNSSLLRWYFPNVSGTFRGGWLSANRQFLSQLPCRIIDTSLNGASGKFT